MLCCWVLEWEVHVGAEAVEVEHATEGEFEEEGDEVEEGGEERNGLD